MVKIPLLLQVLCGVKTKKISCTSVFQPASVLRVLEEGYETGSLRLKSIMNYHLPGVGQIPLNCLTAALVNQGRAAVNPHPTRLVTPLIPTSQPTPQDIDRILKTNLAQQQVLLHVIAASSANRIHQTHYPNQPLLSAPGPLGSTGQRRGVNTLKILPTKKPKVEAATGSASVSGETSKKKSDHNKENMQQHRGVKRLPDYRVNPIQKRARPSTDEVQPQPAQPGKKYVDVPKSKAAILPEHVSNQVSEFIWNFYTKKQQTSSLYDKKMKLRDALYAVVKSVFPYCGLYIVGSSMNGFGSNTSDMDLCLMLSHCDIDQKNEATEILRLLLKALRACTFLKEIQFIHAKVPILKFSDKYSGVECDLNINNSVGIRNTHLLNCYSKLDERLKPLIMFVKHWAKSQNINDASQGTISSYSLVMMVLHYLQVGCDPPVLPSLQQMYPHKFSANLDIRLLTLSEEVATDLYRVHSNEESVGCLFIGFLDYYARIFDFERQAMSVRLGQTLTKQAVKHQDPTNNPPGQWKFLCIEEPFNLSNTARSVYNEHTFSRICHVFRRSVSTLRKTGVIHSILDDPM